MVRPYLGAEGWMVAASLISLVFLVYGALLRVWAVAVAGQVLLAFSAYHFFFPPQANVFPWSPWAAAIPVMVLFCTGREAHRRLHLFPEISAPVALTVSALAYLYKLLALAGLVRWVFALMPQTDQPAAFLFLGTLLAMINVRERDSFGLRCGFLISAVGVLVFVQQPEPTISLLNALAVVLLLAQLPLLRQEGSGLVTKWETWTLLLAGVVTGWFFVSSWAWHGHVTLAWALYALGLFLYGLVTHDGRLRWSGLLILLASMLHLGIDVWRLSAGLRVLTFFLLALILLAIGSSLLWREHARHGNSGDSPKNL